MIQFVSLDQRDRSRRLRSDMTGCERKVWHAVKGLRTLHHMRRQSPIGTYVADFAFKEKRLIIEIDGDHHASGRQAAHDERRDRVFAAEGYRVLRFGNWQVLNEIESVVLTIEAALDGWLPVEVYAAMPNRYAPISNDQRRAAPSLPSPVPGEGSGAAVPEHLR